MSRRRMSDEQEFGSDSFLDVIANIVGILIILLVLVGVRVAQQPTAAAENTSATMTPMSADIPPLIPPGLDVTGDTAPQIDTTTEKLKLPGFDPFADNMPLPGPAASTTDLRAIEAEISEMSLKLQQVRETSATSEAELQALLERQQQIASAEELSQLRTSGVAAEQQQTSEDIQELKDSAKEIERASQAFEATMESLTQRQKEINAALSEVGKETLRLKEVLDQAEPGPSTADTIRHRLSPVGSAESDAELHFRLHKGRIAQVPLEPLLERLKEQVSARRSVIMKFQRYEGSVGPVGGFHMQYTVERQAVSPLQALQYGQNAYRISVARWSILPGDTLEAEPMETALRVGSRFRQILEATDPETVVTIWLYPQDFQYFQQIRELAHGLNLRVAARPLPEGTPIAGSPTGSRSTSQ